MSIARQTGPDPSKPGPMKRERGRPTFFAYLRAGSWFALILVEQGQTDKLPCFGLDLLEMSTLAT